MKNNIIILLILIILLFSCSKLKNKINFFPGNSFNIEKYVKKEILKKDSNGTIIAKIGDIPLSLQDVREEMKYSLQYEYPESEVKRMMGNDEFKKTYEEKIISQYLVINKMLNDKEYESEDFQKYFKISFKEALVKYYLYKTFFEDEKNKKWKDIMNSTKSEALAFYNENKESFDKNKVTQKDAIYAIETDLQQRKSQLFLTELINFQKNLVDDLKSQYNVERMNN